LPALSLAKREKNWLDDDDIAAVAEALDIPVTHVHSIIGFYTLFRKEPAGKYMVQVCTDLPCALRGADKFADDLCQKLGVKLGGTTKDGAFTVEAVMCLAGCDKAPMFQVQDADGLHYHESESAEKPLTAEQALAILESYKKK